MKLSEIVFLNDVIQKHRSTGAPVDMYMVATPILFMKMSSHAHLSIAGELGLPTVTSSTVY